MTGRFEKTVFSSYGLKPVNQILRMQNAFPMICHEVLS